MNREGRIRGPRSCDVRFPPGFEKKARDVRYQFLKALSEKVENPANTAAQAGVNLTAAGKAQGSQTSRQAPAEATAPGGAPVGSALGFLAGNTATLSDHVKGIEQAFAQRATNIGAAPDDFWDNYNPSTQEAIYQGLLDELKKSGKGAANLKDEAKLSEVLECHLWAAWIRRQTVPDIVHGATIKGLGSFIEDRMNVLNIGAKTPTAITMTGHWYSSNTPSNWRQILITWANRYAAPISTK